MMHEHDETAGATERKVGVNRRSPLKRTGTASRL